MKLKFQMTAAVAVGLAAGLILVHAPVRAQATTGVPAAAAQGKGAQQPDPRVQQRTYHFADTNVDLPYAVFVSSKVTRDKKAPLIIALHGLGGNPNTLMRGYLLDLAEAGGYVVFAPAGYNPRGWYGIPWTIAPPAGAGRRNQLHFVREAADPRGSFRHCDRYRARDRRTGRVDWRPPVVCRRVRFGVSALRAAHDRPALREAYGPTGRPIRELRSFSCAFRSGRRSDHGARLQRAGSVGRLRGSTVFSNRREKSSGNRLLQSNSCHGPCPVPSRSRFRRGGRRDGLGDIAIEIGRLPEIRCRI